MFLIEELILAVSDPVTNKMDEMRSKASFKGRNNVNEQEKTHLETADMDSLVSDKHQVSL